MLTAAMIVTSPSCPDENTMARSCSVDSRLALGKASLGVGDAESALKEFKRTRSLGLSADDLNFSIVGT